MKPISSTLKSWSIPKIPLCPKRKKTGIATPSYSQTVVYCLPIFHIMNNIIFLKPRNTDISSAFIYPVFQVMNRYILSTYVSSFNLDSSTSQYFSLSFCASKYTHSNAISNVVVVLCLKPYVFQQAIPKMTNLGSHLPCRTIMR